MKSYSTLAATIGSKALNYVFRFLNSLSWSNIVFTFCLYVFFDALCTVMQIARRQNASKSTANITNTSSTAAVLGTPIRNIQPTPEQQSNRRRRSSNGGSSRTRRQPPQQQRTVPVSSPTVPETPNSTTTTSPAPNTAESSNLRNGSIHSFQTPEGKSTSVRTSLFNQSPDDPNTTNSAVKRYISLFSGMSPTGTTPSSRPARETPTRTAKEPSPPPTKQDHRDDHEEQQDDDNNLSFLGDVDERGLPYPAETIDAKLDEMTTVVSKRLGGVSLPDVFDTCWSEEAAAAPTTNQPSFYELWLQSRGCTNIVIYDWEYATKDGDLRGRWCGENYTQRRLVTYTCRRTTDLHCGSLDASVRQVQMCRMEGNDKLVVRMRTDTHGVPFADCFQTEIRMVVTQISGAKELLFKVGVFVDFLKPVVLAGKLESELIQNLTLEQLDLFKSLKKACTRRVDEPRRQVTTNKQNQDEFNLPAVFLNFVKQWDQKRLTQHQNNDDDLSGVISKADERLRQISSLLQKRATESPKGKADLEALNKLETVNQVLDQVAEKLQTP